MKQLLFGFALLLSLPVLAQSEKYAEAMKKNLVLFDSVKTTEQFQALAATFERIGDAEKSEWLPYYYAGLAMIIPAWADGKVDKDANATKVKAVCDKAESVAKTNEDKSEIFALRNMAVTQQMLIDPQNRWMTYGQEAGTYLAKGKELNPENPRLAYLEAAGVFGTPEQFGGGKAKAKPLLENAVALFNKEQKKPMYPEWGKQQAEDMLKQCQ